MKIKHALTLILPALLACDVADALPEVESGALTICTDADGSSGNDDDVDIEGTVVAIDDGAVDCTRTITVQDAQGELTSFGYSLSDAAGDDISPALDVSEGDTVDVRYRYRLVWGDVAGLIVEDATGPVFAGDEGGWGGAIDLDQIDGFSVSRGEDVIARTSGACEPLQGHEIQFDGDDSLALVPVSSGELTLDGVAMTAFAVKATTWGTSTNCATSDSTDHFSWAIAR